MSFAWKKTERNLNIVKDKYNLNCFPSTIPTYMKVICTQKEREKLERFCFINCKLENELCYMLQFSDLDIFSSKRKKKKRKKERKKERRRKKKRTVERHFCSISPVGLILPVLKKGKVKERKMEKEEKDCWETFMFDISCWLNIPGILKRKQKRKKNCFLNLIIISLVVVH